MLSKRDSPDRVLRAIRRHLGLTKRVGQPKAETIAQRLEALRSVLQAAVEKRAKLSETAEDVYDEWRLADSVLDRSVHSLKRKAQDWDADHAGEKTFELLFQGRPHGRWPTLRATSSRIWWRRSSLAPSSWPGGGRRTRLPR